MPYRSGLADLVTRLRVLVNDTSAVVFTNAQCADALDGTRREMRWVPLWPVPTFSPSGIHYRDYYSDTGNWASDYVVQDTAYADITGDVTLFEPTVGHWQFGSQPQGIAVRATGTVHDLYAAAADLLEWQASRVMLEFDVQGGSGQSFSRSQQQKMVLALAQTYRQQALPRTGRMYQSDAPPEGMGAGPAVVYPSLAPGT